MRRFTLLAAVIAGLALALPAWALDPPPRLVVEVSNKSPIAAEPVEITVRVYDPNDSTRLVDVADADVLIEIRDASGSDLPTRPAMTRVSEGVYTTSFSFFGSGTWHVVVLPDVTDRSLLPANSTPQVTIAVRSDVPGEAGEVDRTAATVAVGALIAGGVLIMLLAGSWLRRPKGQPPAPPVEHDTWWASP